MAELPKTYDPNLVEDKWYSYWMDNKFFSSKPNPDKKPYTIVIPPPNVTGVLHMGHMLNNTIQDVLIRRARMQGFEACWVPGTDHASIATEAKVVAKLKEEGIDKNDLSREEFLKHAWQWTDKHGGIILDQLKKLGASCDWDRTRFTLEEDLSEAVKDVFIDLFNKGYIYRGVRMVNWDPSAQTALSDEEVIHKEVNSKLYHIAYQIEGSDDKLTIATTRPETILGDTAICVNPNDDRYKHLHGKSAIIPLLDRTIPIIADDYVDIEFGTGCLKVTPAHDINDYNLGIKHNLESIDILNDDGTLSEQAKLYVGKDRFKVRKEIAKELEEKGILVKVEDIQNKVGYSERTNAVIEPKLSLQWFCKMEKLSKPALDNVMNDKVQFHPAKFKNSYRNWMENVNDWCISRQLWWGHQIPAWFYGKGPLDFVVAKTIDEAIAAVKEKTGNTISKDDIRQDDDCLDTWFSSWLWPISVFDGFKNPENEDINYYYPTNDLVTAPEIMFFWVARMIMSGYEYKGNIPFKNVYFTGIVRDKQGRKMSKSLGNSPDPIELMGKYGADGVRTGMLFSSPAGNDLPFDEKLCEQGRNFSNKIWNALRLIKGWEVKAGDNKDNQMTFDWFDAKMSATIHELDDLFSKFRLSEALMVTYKLIWDDFCSWYLEMIKPTYGEAIDQDTLDRTIVYLEALMKLIHPFMPFLSEEVWHNLGEREDKDCIMLADWPVAKSFDKTILDAMESNMEAVTGIRNIRNQEGMSPKETIVLLVKNPYKGYDNALQMLRKLCNVETFGELNAEAGNAKTFLVGTTEFGIPVEVNAEDEKEKLMKELEYHKGFLISIEKKLSNEKFVNGAPEQVVASERKKQSDAASKIKAIEESLAKL